MPHAAVHKSKDKKRKGADAPLAEYRRRLRAFDEGQNENDEPVYVGRISKMLRFDRFNVTIWHPAKKQIMDVQASVVDKNVEKMKPDVGGLAIVVESGRNFEIYLPLKEADGAARSSRIHATILKSNQSSNDNNDTGIEFDYGEEEVKVEDATIAATPGLVAKKDKVGKHVERVVREENDNVDGGDDVNIDDI
jgi:hypothetical protein